MSRPDLITRKWVKKQLNDIEFPVSTAGFPDDYLFIYKTDEQTLAVNDTPEDITLNNQVVLGSWGHTSGFAPMACGQPGTYRINAFVSFRKDLGTSDRTIAIALRKDAVEIPGSARAMEMMDEEERDSLHTDCIVVVADGENIAIQASVEDTDVDIATIASPFIEVTASITIVRLA